MRSLLVPVLLLGCAAPAPRFEEGILDTIPDGLPVHSWRFSRDGRIVAYVRVDRPEQDRVVVRRAAGKPLSLI